MTPYPKKPSKGLFTAAWDDWVIPIFWIFMLSAAIIPIDEKSDTDLIARFVMAVLLSNALNGWYKRKVAKDERRQGSSSESTNTSGRSKGG